MSPKIWLVFIALCAGLKAQISVTNGASFRLDQPLAAGSWATAKGTFTGVADALAPSFPVPKSLGGVSVSVDGVDAPVYFVSAGQINFLIPYGASPGLRSIQIKTPSGSVTGSVRIISAAPGLFTKDTQSPPRAAVRNQDGVTENNSSTPTKRGDVISIYATGPGQLSRQPPDGAAPGASPLVTTVSKPQVFIGGVETQVQFSGLNSDAPGLWQINAVVPDLPFITGRVAVRVFMDGVDSNEVAIFVQ
jgi:uncharacterized protein (TIGR03437 family)